MLNKLLSLFKRPEAHAVSHPPKQATADEVRKYVKVHYIIPARQKGYKTVEFTAADVHKGMGLHSRIPLVCSAIDAKKFPEFARVKLLKRKGPNQGTTVFWRFRVDK